MIPRPCVRKSSPHPIVVAVFGALTAPRPGLGAFPRAPPRRCRPPLLPARLLLLLRRRQLFLQLPATAAAAVQQQQQQQQSRSRRQAQHREYHLHFHRHCRRCRPFRRRRRPPQRPAPALRAAGHPNRTTHCTHTNMPTAQVKGGFRAGRQVDTAR
jgi:hypothetical protein